MKRHLFLFLLALILLWYGLCSINGGTPTTNVEDDEGCSSEVVGVLYSPDNSRADSALLVIASTDHVPGTCTAYVESLSTDSRGEYRLVDLPAGSYNLFFSDEEGVALRADLSVNSTGAVAATGDTLRDTLSSPGKVKGAIALQPKHDP